MGIKQCLSWFFGEKRATQGLVEACRDGVGMGGAWVSEALCQGRGCGGERPEQKTF